MSESVKVEVQVKEGLVYSIWLKNGLTDDGKLEAAREFVYKITKRNTLSMIRNMLGLIGDNISDEESAAIQAKFAKLGGEDYINSIANTAIILKPSCETCMNYIRR